MRSNYNLVRLIALSIIVFLFLGITLTVLANGLESADSKLPIEPPGREGRSAPLTEPGVELLYRFTGVVDDGQQGTPDRLIATSIHCTNVDDTVPPEPAEVAVQVYQWNGTDVYSGTVTMTANRTFTFSTQGTSIYFDDVILGGAPGTQAIFQGSGQIWSSHPNVVCTAQTLDPLNYPPEFMVRLPMFDAAGYPVGDIREVDLPLIAR